MIPYAPLGLTNAILPMVVLVILAVLLPAVLAGDTLSQRWLMMVTLLTALTVWAAGAGMLALLSATVNGGVSGDVWPYFERSGLMSLLWGPVLALVWLVRAQGVERRKGLLMGRGGNETPH